MTDGISVLIYNRAGNYSSNVLIMGYLEVCDMANISFMLGKLGTFFGDTLKALKSDLKTSQIFKMRSGIQHLRNE